MSLKLFTSHMISPIQWAWLLLLVLRSLLEPTPVFQHAGTPKDTRSFPVQPHLTLPRNLLCLFSHRFSISCRGGHPSRVCLWTATARYFCKCCSVFHLAPSLSHLCLNRHIAGRDLVGWSNGGRHSTNIHQMSEYQLFTLPDKYQLLGLADCVTVAHDLLLELGVPSFPLFTVCASLCHSLGRYWEVEVNYT